MRHQVVADSIRLAAEDILPAATASVAEISKLPRRRAIAAARGAVEADRALAAAATHGAGAVDRILEVAVEAISAEAVAATLAVVVDRILVEVAVDTPVVEAVTAAADIVGRPESEDRGQKHIGRPQGPADMLF